MLDFDPRSDTASDADYIYRARAAGRYIAFERRSISDLDQRYEVVVRNASTGKTVSKALTGQRRDPRGISIGIGTTSGMDLRRDGAVAWIAQDSVSPGVAEVWAGYGTSFRRLARSPGLLRVQIGRRAVTWLGNGKRMTAPAPRQRSDWPIR